MAGKLNRLPLDQIGQNLNSTLRSASGTMTSLDGLVRRTDAGLSPLLKSLPGLTASLQDTVTKADEPWGRSIQATATTRSSSASWSGR